MKLIILYGPPASGKMTVGQELAKTTSLKLFHNHMSLELVNQFFEWSTPDFKQLDKKIRFSIFEAIAKSDIEGLIFTFVWAFDIAVDKDYVNEIVACFKKNNADLQVYFVELKANIEERLKRNKTENRLAHKASKRNVDFSEKNLIHFEDTYRMYATEQELKENNVYVIDNTHLSAKDVAVKIKRQFDL
ncbi:MAG: AAA family ATPase [Chitinophagales bacterium]